MKCPYLEKWVVSVCKAEGDTYTYVPGNFELQECCRTKFHKKCPLFLKNMHGKEVGMDVTKI